jgi:hypothetical protein
VDAVAEVEDGDAPGGAVLGAEDDAAGAGVAHAGEAVGAVLSFGHRVG